MSKLQSQHECHNRSHYPGTRQICDWCDDPTGRCEDDEITYQGDVICPECFSEEGSETISREKAELGGER